MASSWSSSGTPEATLQQQAQQLLHHLHPHGDTLYLVIDDFKGGLNVVRSSIPSPVSPTEERGDGKQMTSIS
jgi:hypothetical protein